MGKPRTLGEKWRLVSINNKLVVIFSGVTTLATVIYCIVAGWTLYEIHRGGVDTKNLVQSADSQAISTQTLARNMQEQADRTRDLAVQMKAQADQTKRIAEQAVIQARAAETTANVNKSTFAETMRPEVMINDIAPVQFVPIEFQGTHARIEAAILNVGSSIAYKVNVRAQVLYNMGGDVTPPGAATVGSTIPKLYPHIPGNVSSLDISGREVVRELQATHINFLTVCFRYTYENESGKRTYEDSAGFQTDQRGEWAVKGPCVFWTTDKYTPPKAK